ncbi:MAG: hypothetical protein AB1483_02805 [Candidatus Zixiibacteriota bacterium]|mgnify:CR=1 FL=1
MLEFLKTARTTIILGVCGGLLTVLTGVSGEPLGEMVAGFLMYGGLIMLILLVRVCFQMLLGFRNTLVRLLLLWSLPYSLVFLVAALIIESQSHTITDVATSDVWLSPFYSAAFTVPIAVITAYIVGAINLWRNHKRK